MHSSQVQPIRNGPPLIVAEPNAVTLVALRGGEHRRLGPAAEPLVEAWPSEPEPAGILTSVVRPPEPRPPEPRPPEPRPCPPRLPLAVALIKGDREIRSITQWALRAILSHAA